jgi:hypothetical protein
MAFLFDATSSLCVVQGLCCVLLLLFVIQYLYARCKLSEMQVESTFNVNVPLLSKYRCSLSSSY